MRPAQDSSMQDQPKYTGVRKRKWGSWVSEIRLPNSRERIWLGSYDSPEKAARAFDAAAFCLRGTSAKFNFPDQPPDIPGGRSLSHSEIQAAAAQFANHMEPTDTTSSLNAMQIDSTNDNDNDDDNETGYGIFSGFDDYFMPPAASTISEFSDYYEDNSSDGDISQGPSFLWNF